MVVGVSSDDAVVEVDVGVGELVEDVDGSSEVAAEGEGDDEFGSDEEVTVEISFKNLGKDLVDMVEVGALVEVAKLLFQ